MTPEKYKVTLAKSLGPSALDDTDMVTMSVFFKVANNHMRWIALEYLYCYELGVGNGFNKEFTVENNLQCPQSSNASIELQRTWTALTQLRVKAFRSMLQWMSDRVTMLVIIVSITDGCFTTVYGVPLSPVLFTYQFWQSLEWHSEHSDIRSHSDIALERTRYYAFRLGDRHPIFGKSFFILQYLMGLVYCPF